MLKEATIQNSIKEIKKEKFNYFFLFFQFVVFVGLIRQFLPDVFLFVNLSLILVALILKDRFRISANFFLLSFCYLAICILPILKFGLEIPIYVGFYIRLLTAFFITMYFKEKLITYYENLMFILALISLPLFALQLINPFLFNIFTQLTETVLPPENLMTIPNQLIAHKYLFIFTLNGWAPYRNSGFAWEPAAFGGMLCWALLFNFFIYKFEFNQKMIILFITAITTFSVGTYSCLAVILIFLFIKKKIQYGVYISITSLVIYFYVINLPLVQRNIEMMNSKINIQPTLIDKTEKGEVDNTEVSRVAGVFVNFDYLIKWPWGYGLATDVEGSKYLGNSPNGLMTMIVRWGIVGILILLISAYRLIKHLTVSNKLKINWLEIILACIIFYIPFSGNPFYNRPFGLALILFSFFVQPEYFTKRNRNISHDNTQSF
jgi:hypothetical protein